MWWSSLCLTNAGITDRCHHGKSVQSILSDSVFLLSTMLGAVTWKSEDNLWESLSCHLLACRSRVFPVWVAALHTSGYIFWAASASADYLDYRTDGIVYAFYAFYPWWALGIKLWSRPVQLVFLRRELSQWPNQLVFKKIVTMPLVFTLNMPLSGSLLPCRSDFIGALRIYFLFALVFKQLKKTLPRHVGTLGGRSTWIFVSTEANWIYMKRSLSQQQIFSFFIRILKVVTMVSKIWQFYRKSQKAEFPSTMERTLFLWGCSFLT